MGNLFSHPSPPPDSQEKKEDIDFNVAITNLMILFRAEGGAAASRTSLLSTLHHLCPDLYIKTIAGLQFFVKDVHNLLTSDPTAPLPPASCIQVLKNTDAVHIASVLKAFVEHRPCEVNALVKKIFEAQNLQSFVNLPLTDEEFKEIVNNSVYLAGYMKWRLETEPKKGVDNLFEIAAFARLVVKVFTPPGEDTMWVDSEDAVLKELDSILNKAKS